MIPFSPFRSNKQWVKSQSKGVILLDVSRTMQLNFNNTI